MNAFRALLALGLTVHGLIRADGAEAEWQAGLASVKITPAVPVPMAGYAARATPFTNVVQDLFAKALALQDAQGHRAVMVTTDLLGLPRAVAEPVCERLAARTGLTRRQILLSSSHTHSGPRLILDERNDPSVSSNDARNLVLYTRRLQDQLVQLATQALARLEPARLSWGSGVAHLAMNRREFTARGVMLGVNPRGLVDRTVPVLRVESSDGQLRAALFGYACHNTTLTQTNYSLCGDYAGFAQAELEQTFPGVQAMFMMGCGGDANPYPRGRMTDARANGAALAGEVSRVLTNALRPLAGPLRCEFDQVRLPFQQLSRAELAALATHGPSWQVPAAKSMLARLDRGDALPGSFECPLAVWQFGTNLTLVALSGEVVADYVPRLEQALGPLQLWLAAYCNDVFGYVPSARVLKEGGYECRGVYTAPGWFAAEVEEVLVAKARELARSAGRKLPD